MYHVFLTHDKLYTKYINMYIFIKYDAKPSMSIREALHEINLGFYIHKTNRWHKRISYYMVIVIEAEWRIYASVN